MNAPTSWRMLEDTRGVVDGMMPPETAALPYHTQQLLTEDECDALFFEVVSRYEQRDLSRVYNSDGTGSRVDLHSRHTHYYSPAMLTLGAEVERRFNEAASAVAAAWWGKTATPVYPAQTLGYEERCLFRTHCDNSVLVNGVWQRNDPERDLTALIYIGDQVEHPTRPNQYSGGELVFDNLLDAEGRPFTLRPRKGSFIAFPSHPVFVHQVLPITRGYRLCFVNWWRVR